MVYCPGFGDLARAKMGFTSVSKTNMVRLMQRGENIMMVPGAYQEMLTTRPFRYTIHVPTGYLALAVRHGYTVQPVLSLGENETFSVLGPPPSCWPLLLRWLAWIPIPLVLPYRDHNALIVNYHGAELARQDTETVPMFRERIIMEYTRLWRDNLPSYVVARNRLSRESPVDPEQYSLTIRR